MTLGTNLKKRQTPNTKSLNLPEEIVESSPEVPTRVEVVDEQDLTKKEIEKLICVFKSGREEYAVSLDDVSEVVKFQSITPVPQMPEHIVGMVNVRGNIYAVLDLAIYFGDVNDSEEEDFQFLIVINNEENKVAIRISNVPDTLHVSDSMIENFTALKLRQIKQQEFVIGIVKQDDRMIILLSILDMISRESFAQ